MTDVQENKFSSNEATESVCEVEDHRAILAHIPEIPPYIVRFKGLLVDVRNIRLVQETSTKGKAITKSAIRTDLTKVTLKVINAVKSHARLIENADLFEEVNYNLKDLNGSRDNILIDIATLVHDKALPLKGSLTKFFVTEPIILSIVTLRDQFLASLPTPRTATIASKTATKELAAKFVEIDDLLKNYLDVFIENFKDDYPNFYEQYTNSRNIIDLGHRKSGTKYAVFNGTVVHFETLVPLAGATVRDVETGKNTKTDANGKYQLSYSVAGAYTIQVEMPDYKIANADTVSIELGNSLTIDFELEPEE
jgi:hypothetical protein